MSGVGLSCLRVAVIALIFQMPSLSAGAAGSMAAGRVLSSLCVDCHGIGGQEDHPFVPQLSGQKYDYLYNQLSRMVGGKRHNAFMTLPIASLTAQDLASLAAYYAGLPGRAPHSVAVPPPTSAARCLSCHENDGAAIKDNVPNLARQPRAYLVEQIRSFRAAAQMVNSTETTQKRYHSVMEVQVLFLNDKEIEAIASYFADRSSVRVGTKVGY